MSIDSIRAEMEVEEAQEAIAAATTPEERKIAEFQAGNRAWLAKQAAKPASKPARKTASKFGSPRCAGECGEIIERCDHRARKSGAFWFCGECQMSIA